MAGHAAPRPIATLLLALPALLGACASKAPPVLVENVTHVNGVPVEDYRITKADRRRGVVLTVATPEAAAQTAQTAQAAPAEPAPAQPAAETAQMADTASEAASATGAGAASTAASVASATAGTAAAATSATAGAGSTASQAASAASSSPLLDLPGLIAPLAAVAAPAIAAAADMAPGGAYLSAATLVDGDRLQVEVVDADTLAPVIARQSAVAAAGQTVIRVSGAGPDNLGQALRAYANVCDVVHDSVTGWAATGGRITHTAGTGDYILWTDVCPGLMRFAQDG